MKTFPATALDNELNRMRVEFSGEDADLIDGLIVRLEVLAKIEDVMGSVAVPSPFILGSDIPHVTRDGIALLKGLQSGWYEEPWNTDIEIELEGTDSTT